ncbi:MAG TPA: HAMP domain-containing sensor histidine kinase [Rhizomicrobium sp.]|jgi:signal transduction histidine kinase
MILRSITSRLVFLYCLLLVLLGGGFLAFTVLSFKHYTRETVATTLESRAGEVWNVAQNSLDRPDRLADVINRRFSPAPLSRFIRIRSGGRIFYLSGMPESRDFDPVQMPLDTPTSDARRVHGILLYTGSFKDAQGSTFIVDAGQSDLFARTVQRQLATSLFVGLPVLLLAAAMAGYLLMRQALTPVEVMINAAENYTFNDPHNRLPLVGAEPRIEALGLALNRMLDRLDNAYSHVSRFSADAAHELRTPLTIIRGELELVAANARASADVDQAVANALEEMTRLSGIVDSLITLSRMESLWGKRTHTPVDLMALAQETIDQINLLAVEKNIIMARPAGVAVLVAGDRERLKQVVVNLIDNAIKYTLKGGRVTVEVGASGENGFVSVEDNGIGLDPGHHDKIFERFYRVKPDRGEHGAGLGLAIVKSICHAHGGTISVRSVPGFGSCFCMEIPLLAAESKVAAAEIAAATGASGS